jgi:hypothetical protein
LKPLGVERVRPEPLGLPLELAPLLGKEALQELLALDTPPLRICLRLDAKALRLYRRRRGLGMLGLLGLICAPERTLLEGEHV